MDVEAIIKRADEDIASAEARLRAETGRLEEAEQRVAEVRRHIEELRQLRQGFVLAIERYGQSTPVPDAGEAEPTGVSEEGSQPHPWRGLTQADAVIAALAAIGRPATTAEIYDRLAAAGRAEDAEQIRSTIGYLDRRAKRVMRVDRGLWELPPPSSAPPTVGNNGHAQASQAVVLPYASAAEHLAPAPQGHATEPPRGRDAARQVLESDPSRFWTVREVWNEQVRRGWAEPRPRGARGPTPSRIALDRLQKDHPQNVEVTDTPILAYRWTSRPSRSLNSSGASHTGEA